MRKSRASTPAAPVLAMSSSPRAGERAGRDLFSSDGKNFPSTVAESWGGKQFPRNGNFIPA
jgi:hypothetical protein